jgi:hypothetical protein
MGDQLMGLLNRCRSSRRGHSAEPEVPQSMLQSVPDGASTEPVVAEAPRFTDAEGRQA